MNKQKNKNKKIDKLFDQYDGNILNYFCGLTPQQSKDFNKMVEQKNKKKGVDDESTFRTNGNR